MKKLKKIINILISNVIKSNKKWDVVNHLKLMKNIKLKN
jgi:hypothetical protein